MLLVGVWVSRFIGFHVFSFSFTDVASGFPGCLGPYTKTNLVPKPPQTLNLNPKPLTPEPKNATTGDWDPWGDASISGFRFRD